MSQGGVFRYREVDETDLPFIAEMAQLFKHGPESAAVRPWGEPEDFGLIAQEAGTSVAAGWYRRHHASGGRVSASGIRRKGRRNRLTRRWKRRTKILPRSDRITIGLRSSRPS